MVSRQLIGALVALSFSCLASAQTTTPKPKQTKKPPAAAKAAPKPAEPVPVAAPAPPPPPTDVAVHTKYMTGALVSENKTYLKGARQRFEFPGITLIAQCDLQRSLQLHDATKRYLIVPTDAAAPVAALPADAVPGSQSSKPQGGVINQTVALTDTGERKQMFGLEARRIRTVVTRRPGPDACDTRSTTIETDGWYADLPEQASCPSAQNQAPPALPAGPQACADQVVTQESGAAKLGFALSTVITTTVVDAKASEKDQDGTKTSRRCRWKSPASR